MPGRHYIESDRIEGTAVYDVNGHHVGSVRRLIVEKATGQVAYLVINFFGIGEDNHAVPWGKFTYDVNAGGYRTDIRRNCAARRISRKAKIRVPSTPTVSRNCTPITISRRRTGRSDAGSEAVPSLRTNRSTGSDRRC